LGKWHQFNPLKSEPVRFLSGVGSVVSNDTCWRKLAVGKDKTFVAIWEKAKVFYKSAPF
jgi:hypothetical protein